MLLIITAENNLNASTAYTFLQKVYDEIKLIVSMYALAKNKLRLVDG